jgi:hypothetical protein
MDLPRKLKETGKLSFLMKVHPMVRDHVENAPCHMLHLKYHISLNVQIPTAF